MKTIILIIGVLLQFSFASFSQEVQKASNNVRIITIVNPVAILRVHNSSASSANLTSSKVNVSRNTNVGSGNVSGQFICDSIASLYRDNINSLADCKGHNCNYDKADVSDK